MFVNKFSWTTLSGHPGISLPSPSLLTTPPVTAPRHVGCRGCPRARAETRGSRVLAKQGHDALARRTSGRETPSSASFCREKRNRDPPILDRHGRFVPGNRRGWIHRVARLRAFDVQGRVRGGGG